MAKAIDKKSSFKLETPSPAPKTLHLSCADAVKKQSCRSCRRRGKWASGQVGRKKIVAIPGLALETKVQQVQVQQLETGVRLCICSRASLAA
jgi:hypothetical protein